MHLFVNCGGLFYHKLKLIFTNNEAGRYSEVKSDNRRIKLIISRAFRNYFNSNI